MKKIDFKTINKSDLSQEDLDYLRQDSDDDNLVQIICKDCKHILSVVDCVHYYSQGLEGTKCPECLSSNVEEKKVIK